MTVGEAWKQGKSILAEAGIEEAELDSRYLLEWVIGKSYSELLQDLWAPMPEEAEAAYLQALTLRKAHKPLQYITGIQEFMGFSFQLNEQVLIPRQDTEVLVETVWKQMQKKVAEAKWKVSESGRRYRLLDLCCGSGCIGISLWMLIQKQREKRETEASTEHTEDLQWEIMLADCSEAALNVSSQNADTLKAEVLFRKSNLFENIDETFHIIVSNPPYIPSEEIEALMPEVRDHEPRLALDGGTDGLSFYRNILEQAGSHLEENGYIFFEIGYDQAEEVEYLMRKAGFEEITVKKDLAGLNRVISGKKRSEI